MKKSILDMLPSFPVDGVSSGDTAYRERWTRDITCLMSIVILVAFFVILAGTAAGLFVFRETLPIYILVLLIGAAWVGARRGGWKWARFLPAFICYGLGVNGTAFAGFDSISVLFYALSVILGGLLINTVASFSMVFLSIFAYLGLGYYQSGFTTIDLPKTVTVFFLLLGLGVVRWYASGHLENTLKAQMKANDQLTAEIVRREQAEAVIEASEKKFRTIIESLPFGIHLYSLQEDGNLVLTGHNLAAEKILEIEHEPLIGRPVEEIFPGLLLTGAAEHFREVALHAGRWCESQLTYDYAPIQGIFEVHAFQTEPGKMVSVFHDITERIKNTEALHLSEEKFSTAFLTSPDSVNINRLSDGMYLDINQGFTRLMGYTREDAIGKTSLDLNIWVDPQDRARLVKGLLESGMVENMEARFRRKNGDIGIGLMSARIIVIQGEKCILSITRDITAWIQAQIDLRETHTKLEEAYEETLKGWARVLDLREHETANHCQRVVEQTLKIAEALAIKGEELIHIERGALLHDIGKMGVPDYILLKPGQLTSDEWVIMRQHTVLARKMLENIEYLRPSIPIPYSHHEKWDGSGYPQGLKGEEIPLSARIFAVIDVYDALTHPRPYRPAWTEQDAKQYLVNGKGTQFDPAIVDLFVRMFFAADAVSGY